MAILPIIQIEKLKENVRLDPTAENQFTIPVAFSDSFSAEVSGSHTGNSIVTLQRSDNLYKYLIIDDDKTTIIGYEDDPAIEWEDVETFTKTEINYYNTGETTNAPPFWRIGIKTGNYDAADILSLVLVQQDTAELNPADIQTIINAIDIDAETLEGLDVQDIVDTTYNTISDGASSAYDTLIELENELKANDIDIATLLMIQTTKADKITGAIEDNIITQDATGNLRDSGKAFSTDGTFTANSDGNSPTEKAVKTYVDVNDIAIQMDLDGFPDQLKNLTTAEIQQLETIDLITIDNTQWGYVGSLDQSLITTDSPTFNGLTLTGLTPGSIPFIGVADVISEDNANLFWDDSNDQLGIGTNSPQNSLHLLDNGGITLENSGTGEVPVQIKNSNGSFLIGIDTSGSAILTHETAAKDLTLNINNADLYVKGSAGYFGFNDSDPNSTVDINGSLSLKTEIIDDDTTLDDTHNVIFVTSAINDVDLTFPDAATNIGRNYKLKIINLTNSVTLLPSGSDTIDGNASYPIITGMDAIEFVSDGANWCIVSSAIREDHNTLINYVANEHIDHSTVDVIAGVGLSGGGDLTANRTLNLDIDSLTLESTTNRNDEVAIYDVSSGLIRKTTLLDILDDLTTDDLTEGSTNKYYASSLFNADLLTKSTDDLAEGSTNLYYASSLFDTDFSGKSTTDLTEGINLYYTDSRAQANRLDQMAAPTAAINFNAQHITNLAEPINSTDAATKLYVDSVAQGLDAKGSVKATTTGSNIILSGLQTIDDISLLAGDRILVKDQTTSADNGIYIVSAGTWSRSADADADAEVTSGLYVFVEEGTLNDNSGWVLTTPDPITIGITDLDFEQFSGSGQITAGNGLSKVGSTLDVNINTTNLKFTGNDINTIQDIDAAASPTFAGITIDNLNGILKANNGVVSNNVDTDDLPEGITNLYYTDLRARSSLGEGNGIDYNEVTGVITASINTTNLKITATEINTIQDIDSAANPSFTGLNLTSLTEGSIPFIGTTNNIIQDNTQLFWDNTNNRLGIGTNTPGSTLEVNGDADIDGNLFYNYLGINNTVVANFDAYLGTKVLVSGNSTHANASGALPGGGIVITNASTIDNRIAFQNSSSGFGGSQGFAIGHDSNANAFLWNHDNTEIKFATNSLERLRIEANGQIGVGTSNPNNLLDIAGEAVIGSNYVSVQTAPPNGLLVQGNVGIGQPTATEALEVTGNVNISTGRLHIDRISSIESALIFQDSGGNDSVYHTVNDGTGNYNIMVGANNDGQHTVTGDGASKVLFSAHGVNGSTSINSAPIGTAGNSVTYNIGLGVNSTDQLLRIGNPANVVGLTATVGNAIANVNGNLITTQLQARSATGLRLTDDSGGLGMFVEDGGQIGIGTTTPDENLQVAEHLEVDGLIITQSILKENFPNGGTSATIFTGDLGTWSVTGLTTTIIDDFGNIGVQLTNNDIITSPVINLSNYAVYNDGDTTNNNYHNSTRVLLKMLVKYWSMDGANEFIQVQFYDGATWQTVYQSTNDDQSGDVRGSHMISCDITPFITNNLTHQFRIVCDASGGADVVQISQIRIHLDDTPYYKFSANHLRAEGSLTVGQGTEVAKRQIGTAVLGGGGSGSNTFSVSFPTAFSSAPVVICTPRTQTGQTYNNTFGYATKSITTTGFSVNVDRTDGGIWVQTLLLDWIAEEI